MRLIASDLAREAGATGFQTEPLEKVILLLELLEATRSHPFLKDRMALKGGTALNLFTSNVPRLSVDIACATGRDHRFVRERRGVSADTAMRLARFFGGDAHSWLNLQAIDDLRLAEIANARRIEREIVPIQSRPLRDHAAVTASPSSPG